MKYTLVAIVGMALSLSACKKDDAGVDNTIQSTLSVQFDNVAGDRNLQLNTGTYTNAAGESFSVSMLKYYVSNITVTSTTGDTYIVPQDSSYFLVDEADASSQFVRVEVPQGDYSTLSFILGVDSVRSTMDISERTGVLDPAASDGGEMYWGWNSGYIFFKMEGLSDAAPEDGTGQHKFRYHIGGFGGYSAPTINNIKAITIDLTTGGIARVREGREANIHLMADILKMFEGTTTVSIATNSTVMFSDYSVNVANNYAAMFKHDHTEN